MIDQASQRERAGERALWLAAAVALGAVAVLKGLRLPNLWSATQAQIDYSLGFVKRGLFGEAAALLGLHIERYSLFGYLSWGLLLAALALLAVHVRTSGAWRRCDGALIALFGASFGVTYLAHLAGYLDIPLLCLALAALLARRLAVMAAGAFAASLLGILVHESYLLMFFPVTLLPIALAALAGERPAPAWIALGGLIGAAVILALFVALGRPLSAADLAELQTRIAARADFALRIDFFDVLARSAGDNLRIMANIIRQGYWWRDHFVAAVTMLPAAGFFLWSAVRVVSAAFAGWRRPLAVAAVLAAGLSPLLLQFVGWDLYRWYALSVVTSFLAMTVAARSCLAGHAVFMLGPRLRIVAMLLIGLNMASGEGLMDGQRISVFPFKSYVPLLKDIAAQGGRLPIPQD